MEPPPVVPEGLRRSPRWWHQPDGEAWLDALPALVTRTCLRWDLHVDGPPQHGSHALVVPVLGPDGPGALRLTPGDERSVAGLEALRFWAGGPVVDVLRADDDGSVVLLERLDSARPLADRPPDEVAATVGMLVAALAVPAPPVGVPSTGEVAGWLATDGSARWVGLGRPVPGRWLRAAVGLAGALIEPPDLAVDGDVHAGQVLASTRGCVWTLVDPLLMRGDPGYDLARSLWTLVDRLPDDDTIRRYADLVVAAADGDTERSRAWLVVRTVDYWLWCISAGLTEDPVRCARVLGALPGGWA